MRLLIGLLSLLMFLNTDKFISVCGLLIRGWDYLIYTLASYRSTCCLFSIKRMRYVHISLSLSLYLSLSLSLYIYTYIYIYVHMCYTIYIYIYTHIRIMNNLVPEHPCLAIYLWIPDARRTPRDMLNVSVRYGSCVAITSGVIVWSLFLKWMNKKHKYVYISCHRCIYIYTHLE